MMKKLLILLGTMVGAFLFAFTFGMTSVYAEELPEEETTTAVVEDEKTLDEILGIELTDEQVDAIIEKIGEYTNEDVKNLSVSVYVAFGISGLVLLILVIGFVVLAIKYGRKNELINAMINATTESLDEQQKKNSEELLAKIETNNNMVLDMYKELLNIVAEKKTSKIAEKTSKLDEALKSVSVKKVD